VRTHYTLVSSGTELRVLGGHYGAKEKYPVIPGYSVVGEVVAVGPSLGRLQDPSAQGSRHRQRPLPFYCQYVTMLLLIAISQPARAARLMRSTALAVNRSRRTVARSSSAIISVIKSSIDRIIGIRLLVPQHQLVRRIDYDLSGLGIGNEFCQRDLLKSVHAQNL